MVPTLSSPISDFTLADTGHLAVPRQERPLALRPDGRFATIAFYGLARGPFPSLRAHHESQQRPPVSAAAPRAQPQFRRGECR